MGLSLPLLLLLLPGSIAPASAYPCGRALLNVTFDDHGVPGRVAAAPYTEERALADWRPTTYLDGWWGDGGTKGDDNERARVVPDGRGGGALELTYPEGCVTSACAMQAKSVLPAAVPEATVTFDVRFGPDFDWVRGGKMPGLCGGACVTGCREVTGLDGWSSRHMWRPCNWPPPGDRDRLPCEPAGKLTAYVYHVDKAHGCGDDFDFENDAWRRTLRDGTALRQFAPRPGEWYTVTNVIRMNTAGPPGAPPAYERNGVLQVWLDGTLAVDRRDVLWRKYANVSVDTFYFSNFFGGSSDGFRAKKDETALYDNVLVREGRCFGGRAEAAVRGSPCTDVDAGGACVDAAAAAGRKRPLRAHVAWIKNWGSGACVKVDVANDAVPVCPAATVDFRWGGGRWATFRKAFGKFDVTRVADGAAEARSQKPLEKGSRTATGFCVDVADSGEPLSDEEVLERVTVSAEC